MNSTPRISVLMTVFNGGRFLAESVDSILAQSFADFEFVIVDDGSTDGSVDLLEAYARRDPRIRLFRNSANSGQTACLNQGLDKCRAEWVARQDADDLSDPRRLAAQWRAIRKNPSLILLGVNGWVIGEAARSVGMIHTPVADAGIRWSLPFRNPFIHTGVIFRRLHPGGSPVRYDPKFTICQDWELWSRLCEDGPVANLPNRLVAYRHSKNSLSNNFSERTRMENCMIAGDNWRKNFPASDLTGKDADLLRSFREGMDPYLWPAFRSLYASARTGWCASKRARNRQSEAVHMIQAAGALAGTSPHAAASAILQAFATDPAWTAKTLSQAVTGKMLCLMVRMSDYWGRQKMRPSQRPGPGTDPGR